MKARVLATLLALGPTLTMAQSSPKAGMDPQWVQVLLQGADQTVLAETLTIYKGRITHYLPVVNGVGGYLPARHLEPIRKAEGIARVIEDYNPPDEPEPRDCRLDGALEASITPGRVVWRIFNFDNKPLQLERIEIGLPGAERKLASLSLGRYPIALPAELADTVAITEELLAIPPGATPLVINFSPGSEAAGQSDFDIRVSIEDCEAELPLAYPDNANDFYYSRAIGADKLHAQGITGKGVNIAIVDSGLWEQPPLKLDTQGNDRVVARFNALSNQPILPLEDTSGHGTHMSSVIAHSGEAIGSTSPSYKGVAPDAGLIPIKVFDASGNGDFLDILRGIQWVLDNRERHNIRVMNLSLAAVPRFPYWDDPINQAVLKAWQAGITVIAAAGNEGPDWGSIGSPGNNPYVITVGAVTDSWSALDYTDDYIPDFSSRGPTATGHIKPDLVAPGGHMTGLVPPTSTMALDNPNWLLSSGNFVSTGSSQAAAAVAGLAALLLEVDPSLSNNEIKCLLTSSARPAINRDGRLSYSPFTQGSGYVDAVRALTLGDRMCPEIEAMDIDAAVRGEEQLVGPAEATPEGEPTLPQASELIGTTAPEKGPSANRRWGVKSHVERLDIEAGEATQAPGVPVNWAAIYADEGERLQRLQASESNSDSSNTP